MQECDCDINTLETKGTPLKLEITSCESTEQKSDAIEFTVLDARGSLHVLRIRPAAFSDMVIGALLKHAISKESLGITLSNAATYVTRGPKR